MDTETKRKFVHIGMAGFALFIGRLDPAVIAILCGVALLNNWLILPKVTGKAIERESDKERGFAIGILIYPAVLLILSLVFFDKQVFLAIAWGAMAFGDGFAGLFGKALGGPRLPWNTDKGWLGSFAFVLMGTGLTLGLVLLLPEASRLGHDWRIWLIIIGPAMVVGAWVETLHGLIDDNFSVPLATAFAAFLIYSLPGLPEVPPNWPLGAGLVAILVVGSIASKKIDVAGGLVGGLLAAFIFLGAGLDGLSLLFAFFVLGSIASHFKVAEKARLGLAQENKGKRSIRHAISNGGVAGICGLIAWAIPEYQVMMVAMVAASLAAATADTLSSELGVVFGRRFINILTLKPDTRGLDGVISMEGTFLGALGALFMAILFGFWQGFDLLVGFVCLAGIFGNVVDSVLGASFQRWGYMTNDTVNFANTAFATLPILLVFIWA